VTYIGPRQLHSVELDFGNFVRSHHFDVAVVFLWFWMKDSMNLAEMFVNDVRLYAPTVKVAVMTVRSATPCDVMLCCA
jgi:hypothetical protein